MRRGKEACRLSAILMLLLLTDAAVAITELGSAVVGNDEEKKVANSNATPVQKVPGRRIRICIMHYLLTTKNKYVVVFTTTNFPGNSQLFVENLHGSSANAYKH
jgi:hypothetical protein